jgi:hypothetical protein
MVDPDRLAGSAEPMRLTHCPGRSARSQRGYQQAAAASGSSAGASAIPRSQSIEVVSAHRLFRSAMPRSHSGPAERPSVARPARVLPSTTARGRPPRPRRRRLGSAGCLSHPNDRSQPPRGSRWSWSRGRGLHPPGVAALLPTREAASCRRLSQASAVRRVAPAFALGPPRLNFCRGPGPMRPRQGAPIPRRRLPRPQTAIRAAPPLPGPGLAATVPKPFRKSG